ncbi:MAG TPA: DUF615 domain-containing protein [Kofleriaceae bacterium]|nr:DUF615 domain-containing protein [Kofleriaceae bacterium]
MSARNDDTRSARQIARSKRRKAGDRSAKLANELMKLAAPAVKKLEIDGDLREVLERARGVTSLIARRRAERTLAGELRRFDLVELAAQLAKIHEHGNADAQHFQIAEHWRARLIEEGIAALATFPGASPAARSAGGDDRGDDGGAAGGEDHGGRGADGGVEDEGEGDGGRGEWTRLIAAARRERDTGKPPGAARALFRHIVDALKTQQAAAESAAEADDDVHDDDITDDE